MRLHQDLRISEEKHHVKKELQVEKNTHFEKRQTKEKRKKAIENKWNG
jgi:hypothetical protein